MSLKKIKLNSELIPATLENFIGKEIKPAIRKNKSCIVHRYVVEADSMLDIYFNSDGTTSLIPIGKNPEIANIAAEEISKNCSVDYPDPTRALYLKGFEEEELNNVIEKLGEVGYTTKTLTDTEVSKRYEVTNSENENIKIHYFPSTKSLNFQGKGYTIYSTILMSLDTLISLEDVLESNLKANNIENLTADELKKSMRKAFPSSFDFLNGAIVNIMSSSFFLTKIENEDLADYSWMIFPVLRGLEGFIKKLLVFKGIRVNQNFGEVFERIPNSTEYQILNKHKTSIKNEDFCNTLENCYNFLASNRHGLFHMDTIVSASRTLSRQEALELFNDTVEIIEVSHVTIFKS